MTAEQMFGESMEIFSTTYLSVSALAQMLLGVVDVYEDMVASDIIKGFAFFIGYICMMFLILLNIFLAILNDAYAKVQADKEEKKQAAQAALEALEDGATPAPHRRSGRWASACVSSVRWHAVASTASEGALPHSDVEKTTKNLIERIA